MKNDHYLSGEVEKCYICKGRGNTESENHPVCVMCGGAGYVEVSKDVQS